MDVTGVYVLCSTSIDYVINQLQLKFNELVFKKRWFNLVCVLLFDCTKFFDVISIRNKLLPNWILLLLSLLFHFFAAILHSMVHYLNLLFYLFYNIFLVAHHILSIKLIVMIWLSNHFSYSLEIQSYVWIQEAIVGLIWSSS